MTSLKELCLYKEQAVTQQTSTLLYAAIKSYEGAVGSLLVAFIEVHGVAVNDLPDHVCMSAPDHRSLIAIPLDELVNECTLSECHQPLRFNRRIFLDKLTSLPEWQDLHDIKTSCTAFNRFARIAKAADPKMLLNAEIRKAIRAVGKKSISELHSLSYPDVTVEPRSLYEVYPTEHAILSYGH